MAVLNNLIPWMIKVMFFLKLEGTRKRGWDKSPSLLIVFLIVEQDAVVEWALLR